MALSFFSNRIKFKLEKQKKISEWLNKTASKEKAEIVDLNYIFCSDIFLHQMNVDFLNHDTLTDIITFDYCETPLKGKPKQITGEIYISIPRVKENSKNFKVDFNTELNRVMVHGLLHLCGYKDKTKKDQAIMRAKEDLYIKSI